MSIPIIRLLVDFGLLVLIWMIQCIVYPSFLYFNTENLIKWHRKYTHLIGVIVSPLMLLQLGITAYQIIIEFSLFNVMSLVIISTVWIVTFLLFVPIHNKISKGIVNKEMLVSLVTKNWLRTTLWTLLFVLNIIIDFLN